jgi:hypothetical protein
LRHADFRRLFIGNSVSLLGSSVTTVALPLSAVLYLYASPFQMALLGAVAFAPHFVLGRWPSQSSHHCARCAIRRQPLRPEGLRIR